ncbi:MAG: hypothetical protein IPL32_13240 [Chloracidobacterium sp.]|nr:hypothetical protein [Chloracidobacterium sp.]
MNNLLEITPETVTLIESYAKHAGLTVEEYLRSLLPSTEDDLGLAADSSDTDFDRDMEAFAETADAITPYSGTYSRDDIYADHN